MSKTYGFVDLLFEKTFYPFRLMSKKQGFVALFLQKNNRKLLNYGYLYSYLIVTVSHHNAFNNNPLYQLVLFLSIPYLEHLNTLIHKNHTYHNYMINLERSILSALPY